MPERHHESVDEVVELLLDLAEAMHGVQIPAGQVEEHLRAVATRYGVRVEPNLQQSHLMLEVDRAGVRDVAIRRIDFDAHWRLAKAEDLVALAGTIVEGRISARQARTRIRTIVARPSLYSWGATMAAYGVYGAAVAARVGGRALEMVVGGAIGLVAGVIHFGTARYRWVDLQKSFLAGLAGSLLALACTAFLPPFAFSRALFGGMTLLVPAMVIVIGTLELASGALESGLARLAYGLLRFVMLGAGIAGAAKLWMFAFPAPEPVDVARLPVGVVLAILVAGGLALVVCIQARFRQAPWVLAAVLIAYGSQELSKLFVGSEGAPFVSAFILGTAAHLHARLPGHFAATMLVPGLLQLAPGFLGTESVFALLEGAPASHDNFFSVVMVAVQLVCGLLVAGALFARRPESEAPPGTLRDRTIRRFSGYRVIATSSPQPPGPAHRSGRT